MDEAGGFSLGWGIASTAQCWAVVNVTGRHCGLLPAVGTLVPFARKHLVLWARVAFTVGVFRSGKLCPGLGKRIFFNLPFPPRSQQKTKVAGLSVPLNTRAFKFSSI